MSTTNETPTTILDNNNWQVSEYPHEIQKDEQVCDTTGYVYFTGLSKSPHVDENGVMTW